MALPRVNVSTVDAAPAVAAPTSTERAFIVGEVRQGGGSHVPADIRPVRLTSMRGWRPEVLGERTDWAIPTWDATFAAFAEGYPEVYVCRILGATPTTASLNLAGPTGTSIVVRAASPGAWANGSTGGLTAEVIQGPAGATERQLVFSYDGEEVERSPVFTAATKADALAWGAQGGPNRQSVRVVLEAGADTALPTVAAAANLAGGDSDHDGITDATVEAALDRIPKSLGPGQVYLPWRTSATVHEAALTHCAENNRICHLDATQGASVATLTALAATSRALGTGAEGVSRLGGLWGQYALGPGPTPGTTITVPWSIVAGGLLARASAQAGHSNVAPVGVQGFPQWATGVDRYFDESLDGDGDDLTEAGVNVVVERLGQPQNRTYISLDDEDTSEWPDLAHSNYDCSLRARGEDIGEGLIGAGLGQGRAESLFGTKLRLMMAADYGAGALDGARQDEAFRVDVATVNTEETRADGELNADIGYVAGEHVRTVNITFSRTPIGQAV